MKYRITSKKQLIREFWATFPELDKRKITNYSGNGKMYRTDTRVAFTDWKDMLSKNGEISSKLMAMATLN